MNIRSIAREIVRELAPEETAIFELVWHDYEGDTATPLSAADAYDHGLALGSSRQTISWSALVIVLVAALQDRGGCPAEEIRGAVSVWLAAQARERDDDGTPVDREKFARLPGIAAKWLSTAGGPR